MQIFHGVSAGRMVEGMRAEYGVCTMSRPPGAAIAAVHEATPWPPMLTTTTHLTAAGCNTVTALTLAALEHGATHGLPQHFLAAL